MAELLDKAISYAELGWPVFPCAEKAKAPLTSNGLLAATTSVDQIREWWTQRPEANIGLRTGQEAGVFVLDVDGDDGADTLHELEQSYGQLPETAIVNTPGGGSHYYFKHPGGEVRNSAGKLGDAVDIRGDGGYVILPPSVGPNGQHYVAEISAPPATPPRWLLGLIERTQPTTGQAAPTGEWMQMLREGLPERYRNDRLTRLTGHLLRRYVDVDLVQELMLYVNQLRCKPPMDEAEVERIVDSVARRELQRRQNQSSRS